MSRVAEIHSFNPLAHRVFFFPRRPAFCFAQAILPAEDDFLSPQSSQMVMQRPLVLRPRHYPRTFKGLEWLTPKQRTFYHRYLRQAVMDVFNPPDGYGAGAFSLEQLKVAFKAVFGEAKAKCLKEAWNGTFNLPLKDKTEHGFKCRIDGISSEAKKKLQLAFREAFQDARGIRNLPFAFSYLDSCLSVALNNAQEDRDKSLALQKKEELDADRAMTADMGPGADERRGKKNEMLEADRAITTDIGQGADERRVEKYEMFEADRAMAKKLSQAIGAGERRVKKNEMSQRKRKKHSC